NDRRAHRMSRLRGCAANEVRARRRPHRRDHQRRQCGSRPVLRAGRLARIGPAMATPETALHAAREAIRRPKIVIVGTGGTIAGAGKSSTASGTYESAVLPVQDVIAAVPEIADIAEVHGEQLFQIDSVSLTDALLL